MSLKDIFKFDKKFKFTEIKIKSKINLNKAKYKLDSLNLENYLNNYGYDNVIAYFPSY